MDSTIKNLCFFWVLAGSVHAESYDFMKQAREKTKTVIEKIIAHPFLLQLANGTLSGDKFRYYSTQDNIYSWRYADPLMLLAIQTTDYQDKLFFLKAARDSTQEWSGCLPESVEQCPSCQAYSDFELAAAQQSFYKGLAAVLPCYVVYADVATWLLENSVSNNPYRKWIDQYAAPGFQNDTRKIESITNKYAGRVDSETREVMFKAYVKSTRYEWSFWNSAYYLVKWEPTHDQP